MTAPSPRRQAKTDRVAEAVAWLAFTPWRDQPHPLLPAMRAQFELTAAQACQVCREASLIRARAT